eukprot:SM000142S00545  [mRNA]  locus=s142:315406:318549:+ [translate_table: standard]
MAIVRLVNGVADQAQRGLYAQPVASLAAAAGLPAFLVDIRHESAHNQLPTLSLLRLASKQALAWLEVNYWEAQEVALLRSRAELQRKLLALALLLAEPRPLVGPKGEGEGEVQANGRQAGARPCVAQMHTKRRRRKDRAARAAALEKGRAALARGILRCSSLVELACEFLSGGCNDAAQASEAAAATEKGHAIVTSWRAEAAEHRQDHHQRDVRRVRPCDRSWQCVLAELCSRAAELRLLVLGECIQQLAGPSERASPAAGEPMGELRHHSGVQHCDNEAALEMAGHSSDARELADWACWLLQEPLQAVCRHAAAYERGKARKRNRPSEPHRDRQDKDAPATPPAGEAWTDTSRLWRMLAGCLRRSNAQPQLLRIAKSLAQQLETGASADRLRRVSQVLQLAESCGQLHAASCESSDTLAARMDSRTRTAGEEQPAPVLATSATSLASNADAAQNHGSKGVAALEWDSGVEVNEELTRAACHQQRLTQALAVRRMSRRLPPSAAASPDRQPLSSSGLKPAGKAWRLAEGWLPCAVGLLPCEWLQIGRLPEFPLVPVESVTTPATTSEEREWPPEALETKEMEAASQRHDRGPPSRLPEGESIQDDGATPVSQDNEQAEEQEEGLPASAGLSSGCLLQGGLWRPCSRPQLLAIQAGITIL